MSYIESQSIRSIREQKGKSPLVALTAYDALTAQLVDQAGVDFILVGDSLGMVALGEESTDAVHEEVMLHHLRAVLRAKPQAPVVVDIPSPGIAVSEEELYQSACRYMDAGADAVKIEGVASELDKLAPLQQAGIPILGHIGLLPQRVASAGGYRKFGKTAQEADSLIADAFAFQERGAFALVIEMVESDLAAKISQQLAIPTIGIGAGEHCDGFIQVSTDLLNLSFGRIPKFVKQVADLKTPAIAGLQEFISQKKGNIPSL